MPRTTRRRRGRDAGVSSAELFEASEVGAVSGHERAALLDGGRGDERMGHSTADAAQPADPTRPDCSTVPPPAEQTPRCPPYSAGPAAMGFPSTSQASGGPPPT